MRPDRKRFWTSPKRGRSELRVQLDAGLFSDNVCIDLAESTALSVALTIAGSGGSGETGG